MANTISKLSVLGCLIIIDNFNEFQHIGYALYNLFGLLWGLFFVSAFGQMVMAGSFAGWYWTRDKKKLPDWLVCSSVTRTLRYHIGTLAFGSLIIALVNSLRLFLEYVDRKLKQKNQDYLVVKVMLAACKCCLCLLDRCLRYINKNAYIMTAIYGHNFCYAARDAFFLILRNILRVAVLTNIAKGVVCVGKVAIVSLMFVLAYFTFT